MRLAGAEKALKALGRLAKEAAERLGWRRPDALAEACRSGPESRALGLLERGFRSDPEGASALMMSTLTGSGALARALAEAGEDLGFRGPSDGLTPLARACRFGNKDFVRALVEYPEAFAPCAFGGPLTEACKGGELECAKAVLEKRPEAVKEKDSTGSSPLHASAGLGHAEAVAALLAAGADPNDPDDAGEGPLWRAARNAGGGAAGILLLAAGADWRGTRSESSALCAAARAGNVELLEALLAAGADPNEKDWSGSSAVAWAAESGTLEGLEALAAKGGRVRGAQEAEAWWSDEELKLSEKVSIWLSRRAALEEEAELATAAGPGRTGGGRRL